MKKNYFLIIAFLVFHFGFGQNYTEPRFRIYRSATLAVSTSWQVVDFSGSSTYNINTFGNYAASGQQMVSWDSSNKLVKFGGEYDKNYYMTLFPETNTIGLTTRTSLQVRFVVPNGISPGVDLIYPYPDSASPYADIGEVTLLAGGVKHDPFGQSFYVNQAIRTNGIQVQIRLSNSLVALGSCTLVSAALLVQ